jgi:hypothetical protein
MPHGVEKQAGIGSLLKAIKGKIPNAGAKAAMGAKAAAGAKASKHTDGVVVKNYNDLVRKIRHHGGEKLPGGDTPESLADKIMHNKGGLITDMLPGMLGKKVGNAASKHYGNFQKKISDFDIRTGHKIHQALKNDKGGARDKLSRAFLYKHNIPVKESTGVTPEKLIGVHIPGVGAPIEKARKAALPLIGSFTVGSALANAATKNKEGEGGGKKMEKTQTKREDLIEKLSHLIGVNPQAVEGEQNIDTSQIPGLASTASKMLKFAATEYRRLLDENEKLASENQRLHNEIEKRAKYENATKLAELMNDKSMIKKADINAQIEKIAELDEAGYEMLKSAIENISAGSLDKEGFDKLTFLDSGINIDVKDKKPTLADAIGESV